MSNSKRAFLRGLLVGILSIVPVAGLAVTTSTGPVMPNSSSSSDASVNQTMPQMTQQNGQMAVTPSSDTSADVQTPVGNADMDVDVPGLNPGIDVNTGTSVTPDVGVSWTSDMTPMSGGTGMTMHQDSNGIYEAPNPAVPPGPGEDGIPVQPVPDSPPGGTISNQPPMAPNGGFGAQVQKASVPAQQNPGTSGGGDDVVGVPVEPAHYHGGHGGYYGGHGHYYNRGYYGRGYYYGGGPYYYGGGPYYGYAPYYQGYYYYY